MCHMCMPPFGEPDPEVPAETCSEPEQEPIGPGPFFWDREFIPWLREIGAIGPDAIS
jgi:hypothetical protein